MQQDWKERVRETNDFIVQRSKNGGMVAYHQWRDPGRSHEALIAAGSPEQFLALLAEALDVTPEQIARERDRRQGASSVMAKHAADADQIRETIRKTT